MIRMHLNHDQIALIDDEDEDLLKYRWSAKFFSKYANGGAYLVVRSFVDHKKKITVYMHREIYERVIGRSLLSNERIDHRGCLPLDNRRHQLRLCTPSQNAANSHLRSNNTSGYKGVTWNKKMNKWVSNIKVQYKNKYLGAYDDPFDAHLAYRVAALEHFGEFARFV